MIKQDAISIVLSLIASANLAFNLTFGGQIFHASVIASILILFALTYQIILSKRGETDITEEDTDSTDASHILIGALIALGVFAALAFFVPQIPPQYKPILAVTSLSSLTSSQLFLLEIAVAEEQYFRALFTNFFVSHAPESLPQLGFIASAGLFMTYHIVVYGTSGSNLWIVFGAGVTLAYIAWRTGRVSTTMIAHIANNAFASGLFNGLSTHSPVAILPSLTIAAAVTYTHRRQIGLNKKQGQSRKA